MTEQEPPLEDINLMVTVTVKIHDTGFREIKEVSLTEYMRSNHDHTWEHSYRILVDRIADEMAGAVSSAQIERLKQG